MRYLTSVLMCLSIAGCASNAQRIDALARSAQLQRYVIESNQLRSVVYLRAAPTGDRRLVVFFEGDGVPWHRGIVPSEDPTTSDPLALELMLRTPGTAAYIGRPCYQRMQTHRCTFELWTSARYSNDIIRAMRSAVMDVISRTQADELVLVGYSGGGALASLIAERLERVSAVISIAANLDIDTWAKHHNYLPLSKSLNPASSTRAHPWLEIHIEGAADRVVPSGTRDAYFERYPAAQRWILEEHGHQCSWVEQWKPLWEQVEAQLRRTRVTSER